MKDGSYVVVQAFMLNDLHLKGNELIVYAVIFGYTQDEKHWYYGTRAHLAEWCGATKGTVSNCLKSLLAKGYIRRREIERHGRVEVQYQAVVDFCRPLTKNNMGGNKNYDTPILNSNSNDNKEDNANYNSNYKGVRWDAELRELADGIQEA